jgi:hypothetical protein
MRQIQLEDCIIRIAESLKLPELEIVLALQDSFQGVLNKEQEEILEELYWEFH